VSGLLGAQAVSRWGRSRVLWGALAGMAAGTLLFCAGTRLPVTLAGAVVAGTFGSALINTSSAALADHHQETAAAALSEANAIGSGVGIAAPLAVGAAVAAEVGWRAGLLAVLLLCVGLAVAGWRVTIPDHRRVTRVNPVAASRRLPRRYWWAWLVLVMCIALEFCLTLWCSDILRQRAGLSAGAAATGVTAIVIGMTLGRVVGSRFALHRGPEWLLYRAMALYGAGFSLFWLSTVGWLSFTGLFVTGLGLSLLFPLSLTRAIGFSDGRPDLATARTSLGVGIAVGGGPFLLGALSDAFGTHRAFLLVPVLLVVGALGIRLGGRAPAEPG
jgi:predicted MFS family arabinose efflux permease